MTTLHPYLGKLSSDCFFRDISQKITALRENEPRTLFLDLGSDDITKPLTPYLLAALSTASQEMGDPTTLRSSGPSQGYPFLREAIYYGEYHRLGISVDEIFVSNSAKCDLTNIQDLFSSDTKIGVCDPSYPINYYGDILSISCLEKNGLLALPPSTPCDLIHLSSPNNPTGVAMTRIALRAWVDYALEHQCILLYDGTYEAYITSQECPRSIYEIEGAQEVAIEVRSFSKSAGFTDLCCSYSIIPKRLRAMLDGKQTSVHALWQRRQSSKFGGVPYPIQKCAAAIYTLEGQNETKELIKQYQEQARFLRDGLKRLGFSLFGGLDAPYIWCKTPFEWNSRQFFDLLLNKAKLICTPGYGFGRMGDGYVRFSAFANLTTLAEGLLRIKNSPYAY